MVNRPGADIGVVILVSLLVGVPAAIIAGPLCGSFISKRTTANPPERLTLDEVIPEEKLTGFAIGLGGTMLVGMVV